MVKDETLDWLYRLKSEIFVYMPRPWLIPMGNALDVAIKTLEQQSCDSVLSVDQINKLKNIPLTVEPVCDWIPCSERLPEEHEWIGTKRFGTTISDEVYVTFEALNGERFCEHCRFQNMEISLSKRIEVDAISKGAKPVAWCELPQPWKGQKNAE